MMECWSHEKKFSLPSGKKKSALETSEYTITECKLVAAMSITKVSSFEDEDGHQIRLGVRDIAIFCDDILFASELWDNLSKKRIKYLKLIL